jgi:hypothetical protein
MRTLNLNFTVIHASVLIRDYVLKSHSPYPAIHKKKLSKPYGGSSRQKNFIPNDFTFNCREPPPVDLWLWRCLIKFSTVETGGRGLDVDCHSSVARGIKGK